VRRRGRANNGVRRRRASSILECREGEKDKNFGVRRIGRANNGVRRRRKS
jgi:hypothetical protein